MKRIFRMVGGVLVMGLLLVASGCTKQVRSGSGSGHDLGPYKLSVYWLAHERWFRGAKRSPLYVRNKRIAWVSKRFARAIRLQGSGILRNGWLVQYAGRCRYRGRLCLRVRLINRRRFPSGVGAAGRALRPLHSLAVDTRQISFGTQLHIPSLARLIRKGGYRHNGCFVAHDRGGKIKGARLDLFTGHRGIYRRVLRGKLPSNVRVYLNHPRCRTRTARR